MFEVVGYKSFIILVLTRQMKWFVLFKIVKSDYLVVFLWWLCKNSSLTINEQLLNERQG